MDDGLSTLQMREPSYLQMWTSRHLSVVSQLAWSKGRSQGLLGPISLHRTQDLFLPPSYSLSPSVHKGGGRVGRGHRKIGKGSLSHGLTM